MCEMNISIQLQSITDVETDVLVVNLFEGVKTPGGAQPERSMRRLEARSAR